MRFMVNIFCKLGVENSLGACLKLKVQRVYIFNDKKFKKRKKATNLQQNLTKYVSFLSLHQNAGRRFYAQKKTIDQGFGANLKKHFFAKICRKFLAFFFFFGFLLLKMLHECKMLGI